MTSMRGYLLRGLAFALAVLGATPTPAQNAAPVIFMTAGDGSAFLPYGQGVAAYLAKKGIAIEIRKSTGSNENLSAVDASSTTIGTAFMASAYDAIRGEGWATGHKHENLRALFPMYETSFQVAALRKRNLHRLPTSTARKSASVRQRHLPKCFSAPRLKSRTSSRSSSTAIRPRSREPYWTARSTPCGKARWSRSRR